MSKFAKLAMVASVLFMPIAANAAPTDGTYVGDVTVHKGLTFDCTLTIDVSNGGTQASLALSPGNFMCAAISFNSQPYAMTSDATTYTIHGIKVTTITPGGCAGSATSTYTADSLNVDTVLAEDTAGTGDCSISGDVYL